MAAMASPSATFHLSLIVGALLKPVTKSTQSQALAFVVSSFIARLSVRSQLAEYRKINSKLISIDKWCLIVGASM